MRIVRRDDEKLQNFLFFPPAPKLEQVDLTDEDEDPQPQSNNPVMPKSRKRSTMKKSKKGWKKPKQVIKKEEEEEEAGDSMALAIVTCGVEMVGPSSSSSSLAFSRWTKERYEKTEMKLIEIVRERGGVCRNPVPRKELREEARMHIGDTGLLDHLLKHTAGKVVNGVRFMRRHNPDGAMVYWLEDPEVEEEEGPPVCGERYREEIAELKRLVGFLNRDMEDLQSSKEREKSAWQENYAKLLENNIMLEAKMREMTSFFQGLKENHARLLKRNIILERQMAGISNSFKGLKEEIVLLKEEKQKEEEEKNAGEVVEMIEGPMGGSDTEGCDKKNENQQPDKHDLLMFKKTKDGNDNGVGDKMNEKKQLDEHSLPIRSKGLCSPLLRPCDQLPCLEQEQGALEIDIGVCSQI